MRKLGVEAEERDLSKQPLTVEELDRLIGSRDHLPFLNTRNEKYRALNLKENPPDRKRALALMAEEPNLVKRPLLVLGKRILFGFDEEAWRAALKPGGG